jgi:hypothetical protein
LYREADAVARLLDPYGPVHEVALLRQRLVEVQAEVKRLQAQLAQAVIPDRDKEAQFAATAQALGVSLSAAPTLLGIWLGPATPSTPSLGRLARAAACRAGAVLAVLDDFSCARATQVAADEVFSGRKPILMTIEQDSLCWLGGRLAETCDGVTWAEEFRRLPAAQQVSADGGVGIHKGLARVNAERQQSGRPAIGEQRDHFHCLQRARRAVRTSRHQAAQALKPAERAERAFDQAGQAGVRRSAMQGRQLHRAWTRAEQAFDRWSEQEQAFLRLRVGLRLFTAEGELNTRPHAEAEVRQALAGQSGDDWTRAKRLLGPEAFTFLDRVHEQLAALPVSAELRRAALHVEGLRRRPEALLGEERQARVLRSVLLIAGLILSLAGEAGQQALALVRKVLHGTWRSSSLVEGLNSVVRMQQARQKRLTQELLNLKRLYWNMHPFVAGKRKGSSPYRRQGLVLPDHGWWALLKRPPEQLRQELSQRNPAA